MEFKYDRNSSYPHIGEPLRSGFGTAPHKAYLDNTTLMPSLLGRKAWCIWHAGIREIGNAEALTGISEILFTIEDQAIERVEKG